MFLSSGRRRSSSNSDEKPVRRQLALALEQRFMFDAAGAATVAATIPTDDSSSGDTHHADTTDTTHPALAPEAPAENAPPPATQILFVAPDVQDFDTLTVANGVEVVRLQAGIDAIAQISSYLDGRSGIEAINILSHGTPGQIRIGETVLNAQTLDSYATALAGWAQALTADADLLIWGCDVAATPGGIALMDRLAELTGADVAASDDPTGAAALGGDWILEASTGAIEAGIPFTTAGMENWGHILAPTPEVTGSTTTPTPDIGANVTLTLTFDNTAANSAGNVGFGPYVDLFLQSRGADGDGTATRDGLIFNSATTIGGQDPVVKSLRAVLSGGDGNTTINLTGSAGAYSFTHPFAVDGSGNPLVVALPTWFAPGDQVVVMRMPFGSFGPDHPTVDISANLTINQYADPGTALNWAARAGFEFGADALDNPTVDAPIYETLGQASTGTFTPQAYKLVVTNSAPDHETATGSNYVRTLSVLVDPADGTTLSQSGTDYLYIPIPDGVIVNALPTVTGGTIEFQRGDDGTWETWNATNASTPATSYQAIRVQYTTTIPDAGRTVAIDYYVNEFQRDGTTRVVNAASGDDVNLWAAANEITFAGSWTGKTGGGILSDSLTPVSSTADAPTIVAQSIHIDKGSAIVTDTGPTGITPGDTMEYTLRIDLSDYFRGGNIIVEDTLSDGQTFATGFGPTLQFDWRDVTNGTDQSRAVAAFAAVNIEYDNDAGAGTNWVAWDGTSPLTKQTADGTTRVRFLVSSEIAQAIISGGRDDGAATATGSGTGQTTGVIKFRTSIDESWGGPAGTSYVAGLGSQLKEGDNVSNNVSASMDIYDRTTGTATGQSEADTDGVTSKIAHGAVTLLITNINGAAATGTETLMPGDQVTFKLTYDLVMGDFENLALAAYLPLPIFKVADLQAMMYDGDSGTGGVQASNLPPLNQWSIGTGTNAGGMTGANVPTLFQDTGTGGTLGLTANATSNGLTWGGAATDYTETTVANRKVEIYFTLAVSADPFVDRLKLTSLGQQTDYSSQNVATSTSAVQQNVLGQANVVVHKGYVGKYDAASGSAVGTTLSNPVATDVDNTVSAVSVSLGTITSGNIATQITNSNATGFDAGDWVRVAVGVENQGSSSKGAFDVTVRDTLPAAVDANTVRNLAFTTGAGVAVNNVEIYTGVVDISTIAGGNSVSQIAAGATNLMTGTVNFTTDAATTAQAIVDNINANAATSGYRASVEGNTILIVRVDGGTFGALNTTEAGFTATDTAAAWRSVNLTRTADGDSDGIPDVTELAQAAFFSQGANGGIRFVDSATGALGAGKDSAGTTITTGANIIVATYDARLSNSVPVGSAAQSTNAEVTSFANAEGSTNFLTTARKEAASIGFAAPTVELHIVDTSVDTTTPDSDTTTGDGIAANVTVGEVVRMRMIVQVPEGTMSNFQITPNLPPGLAYLNDGLTKVAFVSNGTGISSADPDGGGARVAVTGAGITGTAGTVTPTAVLDANNIVVADANPGTDPTFYLGNLVNADADSGNAEYVVVEFNALVVNVAANVQGHGAAQLRTNFGVVANGNTAITSNNADLTLQEPKLAATPVRSESRTGAIGSETITYTTEFRLSNAAGTTTAYDLRIEDARVGTASAGDNLGNRSSLTVETSTDGTTWTTLTAGTDYTAVADRMDVTFTNGVAPGTYVRISYGAPVEDSNAAVSSGQTVVTWTSTPGNQGPAAAGNLSQTPGATGAATGERNGANTGVNTYYAEAGLNNPPTGTDFHKTLPAGGVAVTLTTADFGYADPDSDTFSLVRFDTAPSSGTMFVDTNGNGVVDSGEQIVAQNGTLGTSTNRLVSVTDITAGRLKYIAAEDATPDNNLRATFSVRDSRGAFDTVPNTVTFDVPPRVDLNGASSGVDYTANFVRNEGEPAVPADMALTNPVRDVDNTSLVSVIITAGDLRDGASEELSIGGVKVALDVNGNYTATEGVTTFQIVVTNANTVNPVITITRNGGGLIPRDDTSSLIDGMRYTNTKDVPTQGNRTFDFVARDAGTSNTGGTNELNSATARTTVNVTFVPKVATPPSSPSPPAPPPPAPPVGLPPLPPSTLIASTTGPSNSGGLPPIPAPQAVLGVLEGSSLAQALAALPDPNQTGRLRLDGDPIDRITSRDGTATTDKVTFTHDNPAELASLQYDARAAGGDPLPSWVQFDPTNQTVSAAPDANVAPGVYQFVVVARDSQGNEARAEVTIRVPTPEGTLPTGDAPAPVIVLPPGQGTSVPGAPDATALEARIDLAPPPIAQPSLTSQLAKAAAAGEIAEILNLIGELVEHEREAA